MALRANSTNRRRAAFLALGLALAASSASATPALVVDVDSGQTLYERDATEPWYPASLTKLMTTYVALQAVRDGRLTLDTPLTMSARAAAMPASKMGFRPGVEVTLDNALKMLMVKSPNDVAVMVAENVSGSVEDFAGEMNATARRLGLRESHFVNPNGLHDPSHVSSARDMAIVARALLRDFPEHADLFGIGALRFGGAVIPNHNGLIGRYPGADGMKTGFTCPAGFNVVASATRNGRRLIAVVLGAPSARLRTVEAAHLLDRGFAQWGGGEGSLESLPAASETSAPDMRQDICSRRNRQAVAAAEEEDAAIAPSGPSGRGSQFAPGAAAAASMTEATASEPVRFDPIPVFIGPKPGWSGPVLAARPAPGAPTASAYVGEGASSAGPANATAALQGALRPTPLLKPAPVARGRRAKMHKPLAPAKKIVRAETRSPGKTKVVSPPAPPTP